MEKLNLGWLTQEWIDFEYKKYLLLAYLQHARGQFSDQKLYPVLSELVDHHRHLTQIQSNKQHLKVHFPKQAQRLDWQKLQVSYQDLLNDDQMMRELDQIIAYALPQLDAVLQDGKALYEEVSEKIDVQPVGITPIYFREGYIFLEEAYRRHILVYRYAVTIFEQAQETFRAIQWRFVELIQRSLSQTYESLKVSLARRDRQLPNPATFLIVLEQPYPFEETFLPIAKRTLMQHLARLESGLA
ncbi:MAG: hypothetical protein ACFCUI_08750 [Bernardetiaceae bacterium]